MLPQDVLFANAIHEAVRESSEDLEFDKKEPFLESDTLTQSFLRKKRHYGHYKICCWVRNQPRCVVGPQWFMILLNAAALLSIGIVVLFFVASKMSQIVQFTILGLIVWEGILYLYMGLKNPGIVTCSNPFDPGLAEIAKLPEFCSRCKVLRGKDIYHCRVCNVCIKNHHHHCTWIGKCVGGNNIIGFYVFIVSTIIYLVFCVLITLVLVTESRLPGQSNEKLLA